MGDHHGPGGLYNPQLFVFISSCSRSLAKDRTAALKEGTNCKMSVIYGQPSLSRGPE